MYTLGRWIAGSYGGRVTISCTLSPFRLLSLFSHLNPAFIVSILIALSVHEWAHGIVAYWLGDPTAKYEGRLTLNPIAHLDPLGTLLFLTIGFGWGKPVPVNPRYFKHFRRDTALVSLAGPFSNLILAFIFFAMLLLLNPHVRITSLDDLLGLTANGSALHIFFIQTCASSLFLNLGLMAFNLLPIAPLDGSKILAAFIPLQLEEQYDQLMRYGPYILLALLVAERLLNINILFAWINTIMTPVLLLMVGIAKAFGA